LVLSKGGMEFVENIDRIVFHWVNHDWSNAVFDYLMVFVRNKYVWLPLYMFIISFLIFNFKRKGILILVFAFITVGISDFLSAGVIKPAVERLRPCNDIEVRDDVVMRVHCGSGYSFPSSHAANHFALGVFFFFIFYNISKWAARAFLLWAALISIAQVYVGVHYPVDIVAGAVLGAVTGYLVYRFYIYLEKRMFLKENYV